MFPDHPAEPHRGRARGPFPHEQELFGVAADDTALEGDLARHLLRTGVKRGIDFSFSDDCILDHEFTVPPTVLRPEQDLPARCAGRSTRHGSLLIVGTQLAVVRAVFRPDDQHATRNADRPCAISGDRGPIYA